MYGPAVTSAPTAWAGPDLYARLTASFGYAMQQGEQKCRTVPAFHLLPISKVRLKMQLRLASFDGRALHG